MSFFQVPPPQHSRVDVRVHPRGHHVVNHGLPPGTELRVGQPAHGERLHLAVETVLPLVRLLPDDSGQRSGQLFQDHRDVVREPPPGAAHGR